MKTILVRIDKKKNPIKYLTALLLTCLMIFNLTGCEKGDAKRQAKEYVKQYSSEFDQAVKDEFGQGISVHDIEGMIHSWVSDYALFLQYSALHKLTGLFEVDGTQYHAIYDFDTKTLETDYYAHGILNSLIVTLGLDSSKVIYALGYNYRDDLSYFVFDSGVRTMTGAVRNDKPIDFYIVTSEDINDLDFDKYARLCKNNEKIYRVYILCSDDFANLDHFVWRCHDIMLDRPHPTVTETDAVDSTRVDAFEKYNLKSLVYIHQTDYKAEEYLLEVSRYE